MAESAQQPSVALSPQEVEADAPLLAVHADNEGQVMAVAAA